MSETIQCYDYVDPNIINDDDQPDGLNIAFLTSIRDVGADDSNGRLIDLPGGQKYRMGVVEALTREINEARDETIGRMNVVGIITDDHENDKLGGYGRLPGQGEWVHPLDLQNNNSESLASLTVNLPSDFRQLPIRAKADRMGMKAEHEEDIRRVAEEMGADVLISDHLMYRIENLLQTRYGAGRILNIHPAITRSTSPYQLRGKTPTKDGIEQAKELGEFRTGGTFHFVNERIDDGSCISEGALTTIYPTDTPEDLRSRNYPAKSAIFIQGMRHYFQRLFPYLDQFNINNPQPTNVLSIEDIANHDESQTAVWQPTSRRAAHL